MTIPEPRFYLKDLKSTIPTLIYLQAKYSLNEQQPQRVMLTSADKIHPSQWDGSKQRATVSRRNLHAGEINLYLDKMANAFKHSFRTLLIDNEIPTQEKVKEKMEEMLNLRPKVEVKKVTLYSFIDLFINDSKANKKENTIRAYHATIKSIKDFGKQMVRKYHLMILISHGIVYLLNSSKLKGIQTQHWANTSRT